MEVTELVNIPLEERHKLLAMHYYPFSGSPKVAISFDSRKYSDVFAKEVASVFAANGIKATSIII